MNIRNRRTTLAEFPTVEQPTPDEFTRVPKTRVVEVSVSYQQGGTSMFTYKQERRGYFLHVKVVEVEQHDGYQMRTFMLFDSGLKACLAEAARYSEKTLAKVAETALASDEYARVLHRVLTNKGLHVTDEKALAALAKVLPCGHIFGQEDGACCG